MPRRSTYLPRILDAAEHGCTARDVAALLAISIERAVGALRYYERSGYIAPVYERVRTARFHDGGRLRAHYRLTAKGTNKLAADRLADTVAVADALDVGSIDLDAALRRRLNRED